VIEQRKARRFDLSLPFELVRSGSVKTSVAGHTKNLSSTGVLFASGAQVGIGDSIEYLITLPSSRHAEHVLIRCLGKVVRLGQREAAATLERYEFLRSTPPEDDENPVPTPTRKRTN
jgi:hypothetical protein